MHSKQRRELHMIRSLKPIIYLWPAYARVFVRLCVCVVQMRMCFQCSMLLQAIVMADVVVIPAAGTHNTFTADIQACLQSIRQSKYYFVFFHRVDVFDTHDHFYY